MNISGHFKHFCLEGTTRLEFEVEHLKDEEIEREEEVVHISMDIDNSETFNLPKTFR